MTYRFVKLTALATGAAVLAFVVPVDKSPERIVAEGISCLIDSAHAVVGRPLTPMSYASVARRTSRRVVRRHYY